MPSYRFAFIFRRCRPGAGGCHILFSIYNLFKYYIYIYIYITLFTWRWRLLTRPIATVIFYSQYITILNNIYIYYFKYYIYIILFTWCWRVLTRLIATVATTTQCISSCDMISHILYYIYNVCHIHSILYIIFITYTMM